MSKINSVTVHARHNKQGKIVCGASDYIDESKGGTHYLQESSKASEKERNHGVQLHRQQWDIPVRRSAENL